MVTSITLRALDGEPLTNEGVREMVLATARAIAERVGVELVEVQADEASVTATLRGGRIEAIGFAAELRRLTNAWYAKKYGEGTLWGDGLRDEDDDAGEEWKRA